MTSSGGGGGGSRARHISTPSVFTKAEALSNGEAAAILEELKRNRPGEPVPEWVETVSLYARRFNEVGDPTTTDGKKKLNDMRLFLTEFDFGDNYKRLTSFEVALLMNLTPQDADEAETLIPTLKTKYPHEKIAELVEEMGRLLKYA